MNTVAERQAPTPVAAAVGGGVRQIRPQPGPQTDFLACGADIAIIGGGAYGGKTFSLLLVDVAEVPDPAWASVTFRRDTNQIRNPGGLWDEACALYSPLGGRPLSNSLEVLFQSGAVAKFWHLEHQKDVYSWDGAQIPCIKFDQLESFEETQFWYMVSRNRDPSGHVRPFIRATCNPDPDSWLKRLLAWWIDEKTGYAIPERSGVVRWFLRINDNIHWADTREALMEQFGRKDLPPEHALQPRPLSLTFIVARIWDNQIGLDKDPLYLAKLQNLPKHERDRLLGDAKLGGNWNSRPSAGTLFRREWCTKLPAEPANVDWIRGWDLAATEPTSVNADPDWTVGVRLGKYRDANRFVIAADVKRMRKRPAVRDKSLANTAIADGHDCRIRIPQDPGQAGKSQKADLVGKLTGFSVSSDPVTGDKVTRFSPFSAQAEAGNVDYVEGIPEDYLRALESFPDGAHDDDADATSEAFAGHITNHLGFLVFARHEVEARSRATAEAVARAAGPAGKTVTDLGAAPVGSNGGGNGHGQAVIDVSPVQVIRSPAEAEQPVKPRNTFSVPNVRSPAQQARAMTVAERDAAGITPGRPW